MAIKNIYDTEISAPSFTWNGNTIATQAWVNANVGTPTLDAVTTVGNTTTNSIGVGLIELGGDAEHRLYRTTTSLIKGTTTDTTVLSGRTLDLYAYDDVNIRAGSSDNISFTAGGVSNAMYINSSGNVGIGTTSPSSKLTVVDAGNTLAFSQHSTNAVAELKVIGDTAHDAALYFGDAADNVRGGFYFDTSANQLQVRGYNNGTRMVVNSNGNIGIGTTSPSTKLHVNDGVLVGDVYTQPAGSSWTTSNSQLILGGAHNAGFNTGTKAKLVISGYDNDGSTIYPIFVEDENGYEDFWIKNRPTAAGKSTAYFSGNVGIGTTSPSYKLHVEGGHIGVGPQYAIKARYDASENYHSSLRWANLQLGNNGRNRIIAGRTGAGGYLEFWVNNTNDASVNNTTPDGNFAMKIDSSGNVGIGTTSPSSKLEVSGSSLTELKVTESGSSVTTMVQSSTSYGWIGTKTNHTMYIGANDGAKITVLTSGNVGIGTTSPSELLELARTGKVGFGANGNYGIRTGYFDDTGGVHGFHIDTKHAGSWSNRRLVVRADSGNVGIGTTSPVSKLQVEGDIALAANGVIGQGSIYGNSGNSSFTTLKLYDSATGDTVLNNQSYDIQLNTAGGTKLIVKNGGNVGIGTTSPGSAFKLDVNGYIKANSRVYVRDSTKTVEIGTDYIQSYVTSGAGVNPIRFFTGSTEKARVDGNGNVGIGTTSPSEKLEVSGNILASGDITAYSDARLKENVETLPNALESVKAMRGVTYNKIGEEKQSIGVIAQEVQAVLPQLVSEHEDEMLSVAYGNITAVLIEAIKEQQEQIDELKAIINGLTK